MEKPSLAPRPTALSAPRDSFKNQLAALQTQRTPAHLDPDLEDFDLLRNGFAEAIGIQDLPGHRDRRFH
ncbi:unnamed protein product [Nezara viridula]|uniref:Uncharacterized protein n=1 Tax=Nezara viridula TaxID=85310 RepID=A0A9P0HQX1_NEZVI|nr:unnamed protein product [Nezara viridula]